MIKVEKHCRLRPENSDGVRILVMRSWPRGLPKTAIDQWNRELAPSRKLLTEFKALPVSSAVNPLDRLKDMRWWGLVQRYLEEMASQTAEIEALRRKHLHGDTITLLCGCHNVEVCHRRFLADLILDPKYVLPSGMALPKQKR